MQDILKMIIDMMIGSANANPEIASAIMLIGGFRVIMKPAMTMYEAYVKWTASKDDDASLAKFEDSNTYKTICWVIDYICSAKVGSQSVQPNVVQVDPAPVDAEKKSP